MKVNVQNHQPSTCMTTTSSEQKSSHNDSDTSGKGKRKLDDTDIASNSDDVTHGYSNLKDMKQIKHFIREIVTHDRTTIQVQSDGSVVVIPPTLQLPNEIINLILSHLTITQHRKTFYECTLVTKQFHAITTPLLWKGLFFSNNEKENQFMNLLSNTSEQRLSILGQHISKLRVCEYHFMDTFLLRLSPHLSNLTHISFSRDNDITDTSFQQLLSHSQQLVYLQLGNTQLTQPSFSAIGEHCPQLQHFEWEITEHQSADWLEFLVHCPLTSLELYSDIIWDGSPHTEHILTTIQQFDRLTSLTLHLAFGSVTTLEFVRLATLLSPNNGNNQPTTPLWWPHLTSLAFMNCNRIDNPTWINFINARPRLQQLGLSDTKEWNDTSLNFIATRLQELTHLTLLGNIHITALGIRRFVRNAGALEHLVVDGWPNVTRNDFPDFELNLPIDDDDNEDGFHSFYATPLVFDRQYIDMIRQGNP